MKRKLDANDIPSPEPTAEDNQSDHESDFENLNLDPRLRQALINENFSKPTLVQSKAIPLALEGKDVLGAYLSFFYWKERLILTSTSPCKDWLWKNCRIRPTYIADHPPEESGSSCPGPWGASMLT